MKRMALAALALVSASAWAQLASPGAPNTHQTVLVEVVNLHCPRCRQVNDHVDRIKQVAAQKGLEVRVAPAAWEGQSAWPDRVFYAARDLFPKAEHLIRDALFDGIQQEGLQFEELEQVIAYFERRQLPSQAQAVEPTFNLLAIAERAAEDVTLISEVKVARLVEQSGATEVPIFVWVKDGQVTDVVSPADAPEAGPLVNLVIRKLEGAK